MALNYRPYERNVINAGRSLHCGNMNKEKKVPQIIYIPILIWTFGSILFIICTITWGFFGQNHDDYYGYYPVMALFITGAVVSNLQLYIRIKRRNQIKNKGTFTCPKCGSELPPLREKCHKCGKKFPMW